MPLFFEHEGIELEVTDAGALVFTDYDIEHDLILADLGEEKTPAVILLEEWLYNPIPVLFDAYQACPDAKKEVFVKTGGLWIKSAVEILHIYNCVSDDFKDIVLAAISNREMPSIMNITFRGIESSSIKASVKAYSAMSMLSPDVHISYYMNSLMTINTQIIHGVFWCPNISSNEVHDSFEHKMLMDAMKTIKEQS